MSKQSGRCIRRLSVLEISKALNCTFIKYSQFIVPILRGRLRATTGGVKRQPDISWLAMEPHEYKWVQRVPLLPGYLHDVESLWWISVWQPASKVSLVTKKTPHEEWASQLNFRIWKFNNIFSDTPARTKLFKYHLDLVKLFDIQFHDAALSLGHLHARLNFRYSKLQNAPEFPDNLLRPPIADLYLAFRKVLEDIVASEVRGEAESWRY